MKQKTGQKKEGKVTAKKKESSDARAYETMSQQQNRHGKGRQQNGSDGGMTDSESRH